MSTNRELLRKSIADAKVLKETALATAKKALEEAFTPHLKSMLSAKLEEMDKEIEEGDYKIDEGKEEIEESQEDGINLDELLSELEEEESKDGDESVDEKKDADDKPKDDKKDSKPKEKSDDDDKDDKPKSDTEDEDEGGDEVDGIEGDLDDEEINLEDLSEEEFTSYIEDVIRGMVSAGELEAGEGYSEGDDLEDVEGVGDGKGAEGPDLEGEIDDLETGTDTLGTMVTEYVPESSVAGGLDNIISLIKSAVEKTPEYAKKIKDFVEDLGSAAGSAIRNEEGISQDQFQSLQEENRKTNLLNGKLMYSIKIFKGKQLTEAKQIKVLNAFDKAKTIKEAKVIYATLNENLESKRTIKKPLREIRGRASQTIGAVHNSRKKQPIVENEAYVRMQKLAGLK